MVFDSWYERFYNTSRRIDFSLEYEEMLIERIIDLTESEYTIFLIIYD